MPDTKNTSPHPKKALSDRQFNRWLAPGTTAEHGQFGDQYVWVNALFSGFALLGVVVAIVYQARALRVQMRELRESVKAQQATEKQLGARNEFEEKEAKMRRTLEIVREWLDPEIQLGLETGDFSEACAHDTDLAPTKHASRVRAFVCLVGRIVLLVEQKLIDTKTITDLVRPAISGRTRMALQGGDLQRATPEHLRSLLSLAVDRGLI